jgi:ornithine carbamoyltransferase
MIENKKDFLDTRGFSRQSLENLLELAIRMKKDKRKFSRSLEGKKLGMIFEKSSTRTRVSFETGMYELGGMAIFLSSRDIQIGRGEPIADTARVLSRYLDGIMIRTFQQSDVEELAKYGSIPVINGLTDLTHPCQAMADFQTILERKKKIEGLRICFIGDGFNMAHSLGLLSAQLGAHVAIANPNNYPMLPEIVSDIKKYAERNRSELLLTDDPKKAIQDADVVITDVWTSMGQEEEARARLEAFKGYIVDDFLVKLAKPDYLFMHCLPAHRGEEVSASVIDGPNSVVWDEAENRLHAQKAILYSLLK